MPGDLQEGSMASVVRIQMNISKYICDNTKMGGVVAEESIDKEEVSKEPLARS